MNSRPPRRLAFELLEPKSSPSALLLAFAPLDEPAQRIFETECAMYATTTTAADANIALLRFIDRNTRSHAETGMARPMPTTEQAAAADRMMRATDADLRTMLIAEMLEASSAGGEAVYSVIQF